MVYDSLIFESFDVFHSFRKHCTKQTCLNVLVVNKAPQNETHNSKTSKLTNKEASRRFVRIRREFYYDFLYNLSKLGCKHFAFLLLPVTQHILFHVQKFKNK